ncbi:hypothetical protein ACET3X_002616 [Alternaria dauci]|uniref:Uncharacterized protein n=1 Tax=Alternaria dauci TaxID=48095 RepID=A0ABR3UQH3_9PLEO
MIARKKYVLGDFTKYSTGKLEKELAAISSMEPYEFSEKLYMDDRNRARRCHMLLVGHYSRKSGGPPVWARATGESICYYSGSGIQVFPLVQDIHSSKIYYDPPFSIIGGSQDYSSLRPGMNSERKLERAVVDSTINFIFLVSGRLEKVFDLSNPDVLGSFRLACANMVRHGKPLHTPGHVLHEKVPEGEAITSAANGRLHSDGHIAPFEPSGRTAHQNKNPVSKGLRKRQHSDLSDEAIDHSSTSPDKRTRLPKHINHYETEVHDKLKYELQDLRAQVERQKAKRSATKAKLIREKSRRRAAEGQRDEYWQRCRQQQEVPQADTTRKENIKKEESPDWKAMLIEQERRTESYKLKCIAAKEDRTAVEAKSVEQEKQMELLLIKYETTKNEKKRLEMGAAKQAIKIGQCNRKLSDQEQQAVGLKTQLIEARKAPKNFTIGYQELAKCLDLKACVEGLNQELEASQAVQQAMHQEMNVLKTQCAVLESQKQDWEDKELAREHPNVSIIVGTLKKRIQQLESGLALSTQTSPDVRVLCERTRVQALEATIARKDIDLRRARFKLGVLQDLKVESMVHQIHMTLSNVKVEGKGKAADTVPLPRPSEPNTMSLLPFKPSGSILRS